MLALSLTLITAAASIGGALAWLHLRTTPPSWRLGTLHGLLGVGGLVGLLFALRGPPRGTTAGVGSFGYLGAGLLAVAFFVGLGIALARLGHRDVASLLIGIHATFAVAGVVVLAAYALVG